MYAFFLSLFAVLLVLSGALRYGTRTPTTQEGGGGGPTKTASFLSFQQNWLMVYYIVMGADWLQGPYVYALYQSYGFDKAAIGQLFIAGFLSSLIFGTICGAMADKFGRKKLCIFFGIVYSLSCITKMFNNYEILMVGRILSGIATSLLFSSFESWMISEHNSRGFDGELLSETFSLATFGNGVVAILAGLVATAVADYSAFHYVAPFLIAIIFLVVGSIIVSTTWNENFGDSSIEIAATFTNALSAFQNDIRIPALGMVQSLFEGAMYTFVFMWTPALKKAAEENAGQEVDLPFGLIFSCYMVCIMIGSSLFGFMIGKMKMSAESIATALLSVSVMALLVPVFTTDFHLTLMGLLVFEICCGVYFPCMGTLRGKYIPEETRAAVMSFFRVPLNALVVVVLVKVGDLENSTVFIICASWLASAWCIQNWLQRKSVSPPLTAEDE